MLRKTRDSLSAEVHAAPLPTWTPRHDSASIKSSCSRPGKHTYEVVQRRGAERPAEWREAFDKMVDSVRRFGWVRDGDGAVRAHIELGA